MKVEYMVMTEVMKKAIWFQGFLVDLGIDRDLLKINCDSMSAIYLVKNQVYHVKTKHITPGFTLFRRFLRRLHRAKEDSDEIEFHPYAYQGYSGSKIQALQEVTSYSLNCLSAMKLVWMNYGWLDTQSRGYVCNHIGVTRFSRHGESLCSA